MAGVGAIKADRDRSTRLRRITLDQSIKVMESEPTETEAIKFKQALHLKLAANVLPRINEHTGEEGGAIVIQVTKEASTKYGIIPGTVPDSK